MQKNLNKIITEAIHRFVISETAGINFSILQVAKEIASDFINNHLWGIYNEYLSNEMDWEADHMDDEEDEYSDANDYDGNPWNDLEYSYYYDCNNGESYHINIFYNKGENGTTNGQTDGNSIDINFYQFKEIIENSQEKFRGKADIKQIDQYINTEIYNQLCPIIEHELTHTLDKTTGEIGDTWLSSEPNRSIPREDIVYAIYLYSDKEMNARIGSIGTMVKNLLQDMDEETISQYSHNGEYFQSFVENWLLEDDFCRKELKIDDMQMVLNQIADYGDINAKGNRVVKDYLKQSRNNPCSFAYYIFKNDSRLKNNRKIKYLFQTNFSYGEKAVYNFFSRLYDIYIKRIYKACYTALVN